VAAKEVRIAKGCGHQHVGRASFSDEKPCDVLPLANRVLRRGGFVIHIPRINVRARIEQEARDFDRCGDVERRLPVTSPVARARRILVEHRPDDVGSSSSGGRVNVHRGAAFHQEVGEIVVAVEDAESPGPPVAALIDVSAALQKQIDHRPVLVGYRGEQERPVKGESGERVVEARGQCRMAIEACRGAADVVGLHRSDNFFNRVHPLFLQDPAGFHKAGSPVEPFGTQANPE
jgi:hypothetical protein